MLADPRLRSATGRLGREVVKAAVAGAQARARAGELAPEEVADAAVAALPRSASSTRAVLNATGVVLHTNLGRAPLAPEAVARVAAVARGYSNLEYDLDEGERGSRYAPVVELLTQLTGAEDALVVNNCAAAALLVLAALGEALGR